MTLFQEQLETLRTRPGFIAALDQSGGSTPHALRAYGIAEGAWSNEAEMFAIVHQMRTRIIASPSFTGERILAAILFENTMDRAIEGQPAADYLWNVKRVVPFLKVDQGLAEEQSGVQLMKPMPALTDLLEKAKTKRIFGTKMRSFIKQANAEGIRYIVSQQLKRLGRLSPQASCRSSSLKWIFTVRRRPRPKRCSKRPSSRRSARCTRSSCSCSRSPSRSKTTSTPTASVIPMSSRLWHCRVAIRAKNASTACAGTTVSWPAFRGRCWRACSPSKPMRSSIPCWMHPLQVSLRRPPRSR